MAALARLQHECWSPCDPGSSRPFGSTNLGIRDDLDKFRWNRCLSTPMLVTWTALLKFESMKKTCGAIAMAYVRMRSRLRYWYWFVWVWQYLWSWPLCFFAGIPGSVLMVIEHFTTDDVPRHNRRTVKPMEARLQWTAMDWHKEILVIFMVCIFTECYWSTGFNCHKALLLCRAIPRNVMPHRVMVPQWKTTMVQVYIVRAYAFMARNIKVRACSDHPWPLGNEAEFANRFRLP